MAKVSDLTGSGVAPLAATLLGQDITAVTPAGSSATDATQLSNVSQLAVVTGADGTKGVKLPAGASTPLGTTLVVVNTDVTSALKVYAAGSETIGLQAGSTAISVAAKVSVIFYLSSPTTWQAIKGVTPY
jgi:hypothetical protein